MSSEGRCLLPLPGGHLSWGEGCCRELGRKGPHTQASQSTGPDISQGQLPLLEHNRDACFHLYNLQSSPAPFSCCPPDRAEGLARPLLSPTNEHPAPTVPPEQAAPVPAPLWIPSIPSRLHDGQFVHNIHTGQEVLKTVVGGRAGRGLEGAWEGAERGLGEGWELNCSDALPSTCSCTHLPCYLLSSLWLTRSKQKLWLL